MGRTSTWPPGVDTVRPVIPGTWTMNGTRPSLPVSQRSSAGAYLCGPSWSPTTTNAERSSSPRSASARSNSPRAPSV